MNMLDTHIYGPNYPLYVHISTISICIQKVQQYTSLYHVIMFQLEVTTDI